MERTISSRRSSADPRLPRPGTRLVRQIGNKSYECIIEVHGVRYANRLYRSLSGAASAAARDSGLNPSQNGFMFWGLGGPVASPLEARFERYLTALRSLLAGRGAEAGHRAGLRHLELLRSDLLDHNHPHQS